MSTGSTPFFPGAWPVRSSFDDIPEANIDGRPEDTPDKPINELDIENSLHLTAMKTTRPPDVQEPHAFEEHARTAQSPVYPNSPNSLISANPSLGSYTSQMSEATESSGTVSDGVLTPDLEQSHVWSPSADHSRRARKSHIRDYTPFSRLASWSNPPGEVNTVPFPTSPRNSIHIPSSYLDPPLSSFPSDLAPISLPLSTLSQQSLLSTDDTPPAPPTSPRSHTSSELSFLSIDSPEGDMENMNADAAEHADSQELGRTVSTLPFPGDGRQMRSSMSPYGVYLKGGDSPTLPSENSLGLSEQPVVGLEGPGSPFAPSSSADLDAFALAAAAAAEGSQGSVSTPDSERYAPRPSADFVNGVAPSISAYLGSRVDRSPDATNLALAACSTITPAIPHIRINDYAYRCPCGCEDWLDRARITEKRVRRRTAPALQESAGNRIITSRVDVEPTPIEIPEVKASRQGKTLNRVKKFGGRLLGLLKASKVEIPDFRTSEIGIKTTTAVTAVEYQSQHPIPSPSARMTRAHRRSLPLPGQLDTSATSVRRQSFLPISSNESRPRLSLPFQHTRAKTQPAGQGRPEGGLVVPALPLTPVRTGRQRTRTAPGVLSDKENVSPDVRKSPGFSLSSAFSRSKLDILRNTLVPHPPLPSVSSIPPPPSFAKAPSSGQKRRGPSDRKSRERTARTRSTTNGGWAREDIHSWASESARQNAAEDQEADCTADGGYNSQATPSRARAASQPLQTPPPSPPHVATGHHNSPPLLAQIETPTPVRPGRRARGFSLSSVMRLGAKVSGSAQKRADDSANATMGSHGGSPADRTVEQITSRGGRARSGTTSSDGGVFSMLSRGFGSDGQDGHTPESELESMSFARTLDFTSASVSTTELDIARQYEPVHVAHPGGLEGVHDATAMRLQLSPEVSLMMSSNEDEGDREEREEERDFMRALGLEFDEIMTRARNGSGRL